MGANAVIRDQVVDAAAEAAGGERGEETPADDVLAAPTGVTAVDDINDDGTRLTVRWTAVPLIAIGSRPCGGTRQPSWWSAGQGPDVPSLAH
ncbi:hypothetical protein BH23ACT9_BH23ACT9_27160 [soil metagenome]